MDHDVTYGGESRDPVQDFIQCQFTVLRILYAIIAMLICLAFSLLVVTSTRLRSDQAKWLQVYVAISLLFFTMADTFFRWGPLTDVHNNWRLRGLCDVVLPLYEAFKLMVLYGVILVSIERTWSMWMCKDTASYLAKPLVAFSMFVVLVSIYIYSYCIIHAAGGTRVEKQLDIYHCSVSAKTARIKRSMSPVAPVLILIATTVMGGKFCLELFYYSYCYPLNKIMPFIVGNVVIMFGEMLMLMLGDQFGSMTFTPALLMIIIWMFGQNDLRGAVWRACCPCCPGELDKRPYRPEGESDSSSNEEDADSYIPDGAPHIPPPAEVEAALPPIPPPEETNVSLHAEEDDNGSSHPDENGDATSYEDVSWTYRTPLTDLMREYSWKVSWRSLVLACRDAEDGRASFQAHCSMSARRCGYG